MRSRATLPIALFLAVSCHEPAAIPEVAREGGPSGAAIVVTSVMNLGTLGTGNFSIATDVNESGQIVGGSTSTPSGLMEAFLWTSSAGMVNLGNLGGIGNTQAFAINDSGYVVGISRNTAGWDRGFLWKPSTGMLDIGSNTGESSDARDINTSGQVTGSTRAFGADRAFIWTQSTGFQLLGTLGGLFSSGSSINDAGWVAGSSATAAGPFHAFRWTPGGGMQDLGTLGGATSFARAMNNLGHVVGVSQDALGRDRAFLWTPSGGMVDLGALPPGTTSEAQGINDDGVVVGAVTSGGARAFAWSASTGMVQLQGLLLGSAADARNLNDNDVIVGGSVTTAFRAARWTLQPSNLAPTANAGVDQVAECIAGCASVTLNGSASTDPDDGIATYEWREGTTLVATGATPSVQFSLGAHTVTLKVTDNGGLSSTDQVLITVQDTQAPVISLTLSATTLWPPNHTMRKVASGIGATDACDGAITPSVSVSSNEPDNGLGDGDAANDWQVVANGNGTFDVYVRAERSGGGTGRVYTITVTATDASSNTSTSMATVSVPKSMGRL